MLKTSLLLFSVALAARAEVLVLRNATLIDGTGKAPAKATLVVRDGRIEAVGASVAAPSGAQTVDLTGKYVMPGIVNLHGHLGNTANLAQDAKNFTRENVDRHLKIYASYGVTAMVSMGSDQDLIFGMRAEQRAGRPKVARIFTGGRGFTGPNGYPTSAPGMKGIPFEVSTKAEVAKHVAHLADQKVDIVKIWVDDHLGKEKKIPMDLAKEIVTQARKYNIKVGAHIFYLQDAKDLVAAGLYGLAHSVRDKPVDDELIALMKKNGAWLSSATLMREASTFAFAKPNPWLDDPFILKSVTPAELKILKSPENQKKIAATSDAGHGPEWLGMAQKNLKRMVDAGVNVAFGTDTGPPMRLQGFFEHLEMEMMVQAGLTPKQVIEMATRRSAEFLGAKDLGTLEKGKWADLIVLSKNPLADIRNTRSIEAVYVAGNNVN